MQRASVFISYAREDVDFAHTLFDTLSGEFIPWMDKRSLAGGQDWQRAITLAVNRCDFFIFCASKSSVNKRGAIQKEIRLALEAWRGKLQDDIYFIPLRIDDCDVPDSISQFQWIDGFEPNWRTKVLNALRLGLQQTNGAAAPMPLTVEERIITQPADATYALHVSYPEFHPANSVGISDINAFISVHARRSALNFESQEWVAKPDYRGFPNFLQLDFTIDGISENIVSLRFAKALHTGGAHPNHFTEALNFSRNPFRELDLEKMATDSPRLLNFISEFCIADLTRQRTERVNEINAENLEVDPGYRPPPMDFSWIHEGAKADWTNFRQFTFTGEGLSFFFDPYHVGSYGEGRYATILPYDEVAPFIKSPMRNLLNNVHRGTEEHPRLRVDLHVNQSTS